MERTRTTLAALVLGTLVTLANTAPASAGGGGHCEPTEREGTRVQLSGACFLPSTLFAEPGETITFVNLDPFAHNVIGQGWGHHDDMEQGTRFTTSFADGGTYAYACIMHPGMTGSIVVAVGGSGAVTAADGSRPLAASSAASAPDQQGWFGPGVIGVLIGAAAGALIATLRHRDRPVGRESRA